MLSTGKTDSARPPKTRRAPPAPGQTTRELLLATAKRLFAKRGFDATTLRDIADEAGVNMALVSYYFESKEGLWRCCLEQFGRARLDSARRLLVLPRSKEELRVRMELFLAEFFESYLEEPDVTLLIHRESEINYQAAEEIFRETFLKVYSTLVDFIRSAQAAELVAPDLDAGVTASIMYGAIVQFTRVDPLCSRLTGKSIKDPEYRESVSRALIRILS